MSNAIDNYTAIEVELIGNDGNAFAILGACKTAIRRSDLDPLEKARITENFMAEATAGDYDHLLATAMEYFDVI